MTRALLLLLLVCSLEAKYVWPSQLYGDWVGTPDATSIGPLVPVTQQFNWNIRPLSNGGLLMWDNFTADVITGSSQQFWVFDDNIYYCGWIKNFFSSEYTPIRRHFYLQSITSDTIIWCESSKCDYVHWTLKVSENTLEITNLITPPIVHVHVVFQRASSNNTILPFNSTIPDCVPPSSSIKAHPCPYHQLKLPQPPAQVQTPKYLEKYDHCYQLNDVAQFRIYWTLSLPNQLNIAISIPSSSATSNWLAIGFGSTFPGMNISDIALGYITTKGESCPRTMTATRKVGMPDDSSKMQISSPVISFSNGILSFEFSRALDSGYNPIPLDPRLVPGFNVIWAVGEGGILDCTSPPMYHGTMRGYRTIDFEYPQKVFDKFRVCA